MKTFKLFGGMLSIIAFTLFIDGCRKDGWHSTIHGQGGIVSETRSVSDFDAIRLKIDADIHITRDSVQELKIEAQQNIIDNMKTYVSGNTLTIDYDCNVKKHLPVHVYINIPMLSSIEVNGSGNVNTTNSFSESNVDLNVNGSGGIFGNFNTNSISSHINGSGSIGLSGSAANHTIEISGSGSINSFALTCEASTINISGSGNTEVFVNQNLNVNTSGSGNVYYKGYPAVSANISGSGGVINKN